MPRAAALRAILMLSLASPVSLLAIQQDPGLVRLEREVARLAELAGGAVGAAVIHLETGRAVHHNGAERFPMASTYKVPIAVQLLSRVDRGEIRLESMIEVQQWDLHPGSGTLSRLLDDPGVVLSLRNLVELMLLISDNSATDLVLDVAGGSEAVTARMRELGLSGIDVNRPTVSLIADWIGVTELPPKTELRPASYREIFDAVAEEERERAAAAFDADPRDTATPEAMGQLLKLVWDGDALSEEGTALLLDIMTRSTTGRERIKGLLAPRTEVAHKTGTIGGTTNDVGIITLPNGAGHVVVVLFVKGSTRPVDQRERAIAHIARAAHDYFLFSPAVSR